MGCIGSGWRLSLTGGEAGQRAGSRASAGEVWKQEGEHSQKGRLGESKVLQNQEHLSKETEFLVSFPNYIALGKPCELSLPICKV